ncbi:MAG: phenylalanine--tRNA ligase subunit beta [Bacillota bacterium]
MKVPYNWLKSYIDFPYSPDELAHELTMIGLEVEDIEYLGEDLEDIVIGKIEKIEEHPDADKLVICRVNTGSGEIQVVTGAPNVVEGKKVPVAEAGTVLPDGMEIETADLRGKTSEGMICSKDELGLMEERADGIMILDDEAEVGSKFIDYMGLNEYVLNLDLTPNYARCLGMIGIAREIKAIIGNKEVQYPKIEFSTKKDENIEDLVDIEIKDKDLCSRYTGRLVKNVKIGPSPEWMQKRLEAAGIRPINNIVDITNYVLLEYNQPLHAFDYDRISGGKIIVRRAREDEELITLDEEKRELDNKVLVIADKDKPVALAGVMGGANSEVTAETENILIESAYFKPENIRKTGRKFGLSSEASYRFERGVDIENLIRANDRAAQLMQRYAGAEVVEGVVDEYPEPQKRKSVNLNSDRVNKILGIDLEMKTIKDILKRLDFEIQEDKSPEIKVKLPSYRNDIDREADLIEEVARMHGYNNIPVTYSESSQQGKRTKSQKVRESIRNIMTASGLDEIVTFSLRGKEIYDKINIPKNDKLRNWVEIKNPLNEAFSIMRTSLVPNMIEILSQNAKRQLENIRFFEIGKVFFNQGEEKRPEEIKMLSGGSMGYNEDIWHNDAPDFYYLKGTVENLFSRLNLGEAKFIKSKMAYLHPGRTADIMYEDNKIGYIGEILPGLIEDFDLVEHTSVFQLNIDMIEKYVKLDEYRYVSLPRYPAISRDLALVVNQEISADIIMNKIKKTGGDLLKDVELFDLYQGKQIAKDSKSLAFKLLFQAEDRTLTDKEVNEIFQKIISKIQDKYDAEVRN